MFKNKVTISKILFFVTLFLETSCFRQAQVAGLNAQKPVSTIDTSTRTNTSTVTQTAAALSFTEGSSYDFGTTVTGITVEKTFTITNSGDIQASSLSASLSSPFAYKGGSFPGTGGTCTTTLAAKTSCTLVVTFKSTAIVSSTSTLSLTYNNGVASKTTSIGFSGVATQFSQKQIIVGSGTNGRVTSDYFGSSISSYGDTLAVSAYRQDYDAVGGDYRLDVGAVFIYKKTGTTWTLEQKVVATGTNARSSTSDYFGEAIALYQDTLAIGTKVHQYDENGANAIPAGAVFVFTRSGTTWTLQQKLIGQGTNGRVAADCFGITLSLYKDTLAIGAYGQDTDANGANSLNFAGAVFIFTRSGTSWSQQQKVVGEGVNGRLASDAFGSNIMVHENTLAVALSSHVYDENGANSLSAAGAIFVYFRTGTTWALQQKVVAPTRVANEYFGNGMFLVGDTLAVGFGYGYDENGANYLANAGAVFIYTRTGTTWAVTQKIVAKGTSGRVAGEYFGTRIAIEDDLMIITANSHQTDENGANSFTNAGAAFVYTKVDGVWTFQQKFVPKGTNARYNNSSFGSAITLSNKTLAVGMYAHAWDENGANSVAMAGAAFVFGL